jgi:1-acyl-sn-glycerol-3-phosphate acyltransferase
MAINPIIENIIKDIIGIENFSNLSSGAIITCNHFNAFDSFAIQVAYEQSGHKKRKFYRIIREGNYTSFPGFFGYLMRHCNTLPLSSNPSAMKEFTKATDTLLKQGHFVLIYPEQEMWFNYRKPRPLKRGAYYYAAKLGVPVVSCFVEMQNLPEKDVDGFYKVKFVIHILPTIYPDSSKTVKENSIIMCQRDYEQKKKAYESAYGKPLVYTFEEDDIAGWMGTEPQKHTA